jgi:hypothetical protein
MFRTIDEQDNQSFRWPTLKACWLQVRARVLIWAETEGEQASSKEMRNKVAAE